MKDRYWIAICATLLFLGIIIGSALERVQPPRPGTPIPISKYRGRTEIVTTSVNGEETSRDTLFIFTPR
jgi:hypothetical protein